MRGFGGLGGGGGGSGGSQGSCTEQIKAGWAKIPLFNKFVFTTCCIIYFLSFIVIQVLTYTMLRPIDIIHFQVWKLITGPFAHPQLLMLLFSLLSYIPSAIYEEKEMGTVPFTLRFFKLSLVINILFCSISIPVAMFIAPSFIKTPEMGLWPILFCDLVI
jgi:membrane associated rhomboid family serine protease